MSSLTQHMRTQCVGRILIDLPDGSVWKSKTNGGRVGDLSFSVTTGVSRDEYAARVERRWAEILALKILHSVAIPQAPHSFRPAADSIVFAYDFRQSNSPDVHGIWANRISYETEGAIWLSGTMITIGPQLDSQEEIVELMARMRAREADQIPNEPGLCVDGAFIAGYYDPTEREEITWGFQLPRNLGLVIQHSKVWSARKSMLERRNQSAREIAGYVAKLLSEPGVVAGNRKYRAALRTGDLLPGEEFVMGGTQGINGGIFETNVGGLWEFPGRGFPSPMPSIELNMGTTFQTLEKPSPLGAFSTHKGDQNTPTEAEFFEIWDAVVSSVRVRPVALTLPPTKAIAPPKISSEQAEADRRALDAFIADGPALDLSDSVKKQ
ncbi:T6SS immunity protein Tli4 family protein [Achromobacter sp. Root83]|uniref:T6SS immunity protein Tli4 family protein n=1 Tax=Achromobacter sp. Root83 TaxID=1736602 RepID=UPI0012E39FE2|nr:T6SS immunity protein Tli4 family protein [Achromobacter sp. Root83]